jgi:high-affinity K+ transport system ATPase subunit B
MTQNQMIISHLKKHGSITPLEALRKIDCMRLAARIEELRGMGHDIKTVMIKNKNKRFARYILGSSK